MLDKLESFHKYEAKRFLSCYDSERKSQVRHNWQDPEKHRLSFKNRRCVNFQCSASVISENMTRTALVDMASNHRTAFLPWKLG